MASIQQTLTAGTDLSAAIEEGGTSQQVAPANTSRKRLILQNISDTDMWVTDIQGTARADIAGNWKVAAGASWEAATNREVSVVCGSTGKLFTALEV